MAWIYPVKGDNIEDEFDIFNRNVGRFLQEHTTSYSTGRNLQVHCNEKLKSENLLINGRYQFFFSWETK
jgi:hypothetical protein